MSETGGALIDGKAVAQKVREEVKLEAEAFEKEFGRKPGLHVVLVGDDPASAVYVRNKEAAADRANIAGAVHRLPQDASEAAVLGLVQELNAQADVDGILVQFPVPAQVSQAAVLRVIDPDKDVDGLHAVNVGRLWAGLPGLVACTPSGCMRLLAEQGVELSGQRAIIIGRSNLVGKPMAALLLQQDATVTLAHSRTAELSRRCREADVVIAAVGRAKIVTAEFIKPGAVVIDVGMNRDEGGKLCGDVDFDAVRPLAKAITPVPGGVGPMTIAMLLGNTVKAARARESG